ncbi:MAG: hypothetical protein COA86_01355 [Kangiella sp.]|nr:MAG: hypothetical protein COA86_01355 [Kangiella sp.]
MKCKICIKSLTQNEVNKSSHSSCLKRLFANSKVSMALTYPRAQFQQQVRVAVQSGRMSISGVQPKAQMDLKSKNGPLVVVESGGDYILKPTPEGFPEAAINEHLSMQLAKIAGFIIPECGLVGFESVGEEQREEAYIVKRFDRDGEKKLHHEDMMQILAINNLNTDAKYDAATYYDVLRKISDMAGLGVTLEAMKRIIFNYLIGNDDYHLKNISMMHGKTLNLTPIYDCLNTQIYSSKTNSPLALKLTNDDQSLPYYGKMGNGLYAKDDFLELAESVGLPIKLMEKEIKKLLFMIPSMIEMVKDSGLSDGIKQQYSETLFQRIKLLSI